MVCTFCSAESELVGHVLKDGAWLDIPVCSGHKHEISNGGLEKLPLALPAVDEPSEGLSTSVDPLMELVCGPVILAFEDVFEESAGAPVSDVVGETDKS